jgi:hypothetical protein
MRTTLEHQSFHIRDSEISLHSIVNPPPFQPFFPTILFLPTTTPTTINLIHFTNLLTNKQLQLIHSTQSTHSPFSTNTNSSLTIHFIHSKPQLSLHSLTHPTYININISSLSNILTIQSQPPHPHRPPPQPTPKQPHIQINTTPLSFTTPIPQTQISPTNFNPPTRTSVFHSFFFRPRKQDKDITLLNFQRKGRDREETRNRCLCTSPKNKCYVSSCYFNGCHSSTKPE